MTVYLPIVKLANVATGQAEVRLFTPFSRDVPFGTSASLGWVVRRAGGRWIAQDTSKVPVGAFATRSEAVADLVARARRGADA